MPIEIQQLATEPASRAPRRSLGEIRIGKDEVTGQDRIFFTERLALLLETGNALHASLAALEEQAGSGPMREVISKLHEGVTGGQSFSQALAGSPEVFTPAYVSVVAAGEQGGFLHKVLERLRDLDAKRQELRSTLLSAFSYPAFLVVFSVAVVLFVLMVVFPKFGDLFQMIWDQLPWTTRVLMTTSRALLLYWPYALLGLAVAGFGAWRWLSRPAGKAALERVALGVPVLREIVVLYQLVQFLYVMSLALGNGVPMLDALRACREVVASPGFRDFVLNLEQHVSEGRRIAEGFEEADFVPPLVRQMIATGEESGSLAMVMGRMAEFYERDWKQRLDVLAKLVEPAMLVIMGVVVGVIVSSLILPIFKLSTTVR